MLAVEGEFYTGSGAKEASERARAAARPRPRLYDTVPSSPIPTAAIWHNRQETRQRTMARRQDLDRTPRSPGRVRDPTHYEDATAPRSPDEAPRIDIGPSGEGRARPELLSIHTSDAMLRGPDGHQAWNGNGNGHGPSAHHHHDTRMESTAASSATDAIIAQLHLIQSLQVRAIGSIAACIRTSYLTQRIAALRYGHRRAKSPQSIRRSRTWAAAGTMMLAGMEKARAAVLACLQH